MTFEVFSKFVILYIFIKIIKMCNWKMLIIFSKPAETATYFSKHRVWSRFVMIVCVMAYVWYTSKNGKETSLAKQKDVLQNRGQSFPCDPDYLSEIEEFPGCKPKKCGRFVSDKLVTSTEANILLSIAKKGRLKLLI